MVHSYMINKLMREFQTNILLMYHSLVHKEDHDINRKKTVAAQ